MIIFEVEPIILGLLWQCPFLNTSGNPRYFNTCIQGSSVRSQTTLLVEKQKLVQTAISSADSHSLENDHAIKHRKTCTSLTNYMEQNPFWQDYHSSSSQKSPRDLWNPNVHYHVHNSQSSVLMLSQINVVQAPVLFLKIHFNIIFPSTSRFPKWSLFLNFPHHNPVFTSHLLRPCNVPWDVDPVAKIYIHMAKIPTLSSILVHESGAVWRQAQNVVDTNH